MERPPYVTVHLLSSTKTCNSGTLLTWSGAKRTLSDVKCSSTSLAAARQVADSCAAVGKVSRNQSRTMCVCVGGPEWTVTFPQTRLGLHKCQVSQRVRRHGQRKKFHLKRGKSGEQLRKSVQTVARTSLVYLFLISAAVFLVFQKELQIFAIQIHKGG